MTRDLFAVVNLLVLTWDFNQSECPPVVLWFCVDKIVYIYTTHIVKLYSLSDKDITLVFLNPYGVPKYHSGGSEK